MTCHEYERELDDYVDGTLTAARAAAIAAHLDVCPECRGTVADFTAIRSAARALEPQMPAAYVWTRLAAALEHEQRLPWWRLASGAFAWRPIAAAAIMLTLLVGATWMAWQDAAPDPVARTATVAGEPAGAAGGPVQPAVQIAEEDYRTAIGDLEKVTQTQGGSLDPETARVVQANLAVLDQAIGQSRAALQSEPTSSIAQESLFDALRSKVQLLQDTVALINEMRKGNQEGAARIMSGMNP